MAKAYDRVSWIFLTKVLRKFGFSERMINMIWRLTSNNWYSFFQSSRGLKQGGPLSPTLFIIAAKVLPRGLNKLQEDGEYRGYGMPKWSSNINHLSYVDDTILFCSRDKKSVQKMMKVLANYEQVSGQMINKNKCFFYLHEKAPIVSGQRLRRWTGIQQGHFPFTYLGCPVFYGRKKISHFEYILAKINKRVMCWQNKFLSYGGRQILVAHVL
ncbi:hypothetical protein MTR67_037447 [Solanum verrucosum]|uniref:Reverse transcriptase domain-containing protein n=1 Tax=Solanum verrucosum TaxID=315347 RepID=A0AAF0UDM5_SOLVR|nr:hypothetical protein MTR67_037447 [Solanum verrucosum]